MHILHFDVDALEAPYGGGQARRTFEVNRRLARRHEVTVVTAGHPTLRNHVVEGVRYVRMLALPHPANFAWYFAEILPRAIASRADIIVEDFSWPMTASGLPMLVRRPVVGLASYFLGKHLAARYHIPIDRWESVALRRYRHLIALSGSQQQALRSLAPHADVRIIGNAPDDGAFAEPWRGDGAYVAFIGRFDWWAKGLDLLLDAAAQLPDSLRLKIAGDGPGRKQLAHEIQRRNLSPAVCLVGGLRGQDRHRFVARARALAFPSRYENQSLVALDALAIGVPIVAFDVESSRDVFGDAAALVPPFDTAAFAAEIVALAGGGNQARTLSEKAQRRVASLRWDQTAGAQESFYTEILAAR